ncbi:hypothetical protein Tco_0239722 [Tanacetum coccineum]
MAGALGAHNAVRNLEPLMRDEGNGNGGNGNGNGNGVGNGYNFGGFVPAQECTYQDFLKRQPLSFNGTEGVVGLTRWFEKMETVFHISNCPEKYQVNVQRSTKAYEVDDRGVLPKKRDSEDGNRVMELGCERKRLDYLYQKISRIGAVMY